MLCQSCQFPDYMYNTKEPWRILSPEQGFHIQHTDRVITFNDNEIQVQYMTNQICQFTYLLKCFKNMENNTYLVQQQVQGLPPKYACLQFMQRDINVVQWKWSGWERYQHDIKCDERYITLELQDAPLVYYNHRPGYWQEHRNLDFRYRACPLDGGYIMTWMDNSGRTACTDVLDTVKLENECTKGEGLVINGLGSKCKLPHKDLKERYYCLSSWSHGIYTFMVLIDPNDEFHMPCMRYQTLHHQSFIAHIYMDGICDTSSDNHKSSDVLTLYLQRHRVPNICTDESPLCENLARNRCDIITTKICRGTCDACPPNMDQLWDVFAFPQEYQGKWLKQSAQLGKETIMIEGRKFIVPSLGTFYSFGESGCMEGKYKRPTHGLGEQVKEYVLLSFTNNGCSPRVSSLMISKHTNTLLRYRLSPAASVRVFVNQNYYINGEIRQHLGYWGYMCKFADYRYEPMPVGTLFRPSPVGWLNMIKTDDHLILKPCLFPISGQQFSVTFSDSELNIFGRSCSGYTQTAAFSVRKTIDLNIQGCIAPNGSTIEHNIQNKQVFHCLAQFGDYNNAIDVGNQLLITNNPQQELSDQEFLCWIFTVRPEVLYWYPISHCNTLGASELKLLVQQSKPIAKFTFEPSTYVVIGAADSVVCSLWQQTVFLLFCVVFCF